MSLLLLMASVLEGEMKGALDNTIRLQSGHLQVRPASYDENKISLQWEDLIENPGQVAEQIKSVPNVTVATPRLIASSILTVSNESKGVQILGIEPDSAANQPFRDGLLDGEFIRADDREGILIGNILAESCQHDLCRIERPESSRRGGTGATVEQFEDPHLARSESVHCPVRRLRQRILRHSLPDRARHHRHGRHKYPGHGSL
jgi:hypothetical protein